MCDLNQKQEDNAMLSVIERWWPTQKENLSGLRRVDAKEMLRLVSLCLDDLRESDDCSKTAEYIPTKIAAEIENLCEHAPANDRKRCAACVCMLVSVCITMINATTIGNRKLMWAQSHLQHKMEQFEDVDQLFEGLWACIEECGADKMSACARMFYERTAKEPDAKENHNTQEHSAQTYDITPERWVELYGKRIGHNFNDETALAKHIKKLRGRYEDQLSKVQKDNKKNWKTTFLRKQVCHPDVAWIKDLNTLKYEMIQGIYGKNAFSPDQLTDAKMLK